MSGIADRLTGSWSLVKWTISFDDGRPAIEPFNAGATGRIHYCSDGIMNATIMAAGHATMPVNTAEARARLLKRYMHYTGAWRVEGESVIHRVDFALDPGLIGRDLPRGVTFEGNDLILTGEDKSPRDGSAIHHELRWRRDKRAE